ncbi:unnamed protein product, partial [Candidula unifasciata]
MAENSKVKYVDTNTALVKMTSGVPFTSSSAMSDSEDDGFVDNHNRDFDFAIQDMESKSIDYINTAVEHKINKDTTKESISNQAPHQQIQHRQCTLNYQSSVKLPSASPGTTYRGISNDVGSFPGQLLRHKDETESETSEQDLTSRQNLPERADRECNKVTDSLASSRSWNDFQSVAVDSGKRKSGADTHRAEASPSRKHKQSSQHVSVKSLREQGNTNRLSQSLENSQWESGMAVSNSMSAISKTSHRHKVNAGRMNPFNNELLIDEDHFSDTYENYFRSDRHSTSSTRSSSVSQGPDWQHDPSDISFAELGLSEDHFSHPQGHFGLSGAEELELAIENCKELIRDTVPGSDKQKNLVLKLVQLKIKLQEVKEGPEPVPDNVKLILSHKMMLMSSRTSKYYCERCNAAIWGMLQVWYKCTECGYRCHEKCLQQILRTCAKAKVLENPTLITEICPKESNGLAGQNYRCWECRSAISYKSGHSEPRLCDYTGRYYCEFCHWNNTFVMPARVLHNWDFTPHKVCRASKQFLRLMQKKAVIRIQDINPMLFVYVDQLNEIK